MSTALQKRPQGQFAYATPSGSRARSLARQLSVMLPDAAVIRVRLLDPMTAWPHMEATATDESGARVRVNRTQRITAARWIIRTYPDAGWQNPHIFDVRLACLDAGQPSGAVDPTIKPNEFVP